MSEEAVTRNEIDFDPAQFAKRVYRHEIFTSDMIAPEDQLLTTSIFLPLAMLTSEQREQMIAEKVSCFYAERSEALDRSVNGYPMFMGFGTLTVDQHVAFHAEYMKIVELLGS